LANREGGDCEVGNETMPDVMPSSQPNRQPQPAHSQRRNEQQPAALINPADLDGQARSRPGQMVYRRLIPRRGK